MLERPLGIGAPPNRNGSETVGQTNPIYASQQSVLEVAVKVIIAKP
jgi:hypothetical protein